MNTSQLSSTRWRALHDVAAMRRRHQRFLLGWCAVAVLILAVLPFAARQSGGLTPGGILGWAIVTALGLVPLLNAARAARRIEAVEFSELGLRGPATGGTEIAIVRWEDMRDFQLRGAMMLVGDGSSTLPVLLTAVTTDPEGRAALRRLLDRVPQR